jgi:hypothetical protein
MSANTRSKQTPEQTPETPTPETPEQIAPETPRDETPEQTPEQTADALAAAKAQAEQHLRDESEAYCAAADALAGAEQTFAVECAKVGQYLGSVQPLFGKGAAASADFFAWAADATRDYLGRALMEGQVRRYIAAGHALDQHGTEIAERFPSVKALAAANGLNAEQVTTALALADEVAAEIGDSPNGEDVVNAIRVVTKAETTPEQQAERDAKAAKRLAGDLRDEIQRTLARVTKGLSPEQTAAMTKVAVNLLAQGAEIGARHGKQAAAAVRLASVK